MENVKPYSKTGMNAFEGWDSFVQSGELRELDEPHTWEELNAVSARAFLWRAMTRRR